MIAGGIMKMAEEDVSNPALRKNTPMTETQSEFLAKVAFLALLGSLAPYLFLPLLLLPGTSSGIVLGFVFAIGFLSAIVAWVLGRICRQHQKPVRTGMQRVEHRPNLIFCVWHHLFEKTAIVDAFIWITVAVLAIYYLSHNH
jgi:hypothetical protein